MLAVSDDGEGMDTETMKRVFEPFFTTKKEGEGTGLGLSTVYGIAKQHGGHIEVYSEIGEGTTFKVYFPLVLAKADSTAKTAAMAGLPKGTETILVVEDEEMVRKVAVRILTRLGYNVMSANDGNHALVVTKENDVPVDLVLTDVVMPEMNGREMAEKLGEQHPEMKILYTSGYTKNVISQHGVLDEGLDFVGKPYTPLELAQKVREVLDS